MTKTLLMNNRTVYVIADSHLGAKEGDVDVLIQFLSSLMPSQSEVLFLGDLFHIWAGPEKFHTELVKKLLGFLANFRQQNGLVYLVTGNRDVFFPEIPGKKATSLPFDRIATESFLLKKQYNQLLAIHGDTINSRDHKYLRWRALIRNPLFQLPFRLMPSSKVKKIMFSLEEKLKLTNMAFRRSFPQEEWLKFLKNINFILAPKLLIAGHFHPDALIEDRVEETTGLVIPDWCDHYFYLTIDESLNYYTHCFEATPNK